MNEKEKIHALSEELITNLGRLVAIDSQLGTPEEGKPFGKGPAKALEEGLKIAEELGLLEKVQKGGWKSLSSRETGKIGGILSTRRRAQAKKEKSEQV